MSKEKNLNTEFRTLWNLNIGFNSLILRLSECVLLQAGGPICRTSFKNYLTGVVYRVDEIIESLGLERSVYYNRRQEAVLLFGYALWAIVIPREKVNARTESGG